MNTKLMRLLSVIIVMILSLTLCFGVMAENEDSADASSEAVSEASSEAAADESKDGSGESEKSESSAVSAADNGEDTENNDETPASVSTFPWPRVIALGIILVLIIAAVILAQTKTAFGQKINKFFKDYKSEIKKISWSSPKDTAKATGVVLVFIIGAAAVIGLLDWGFGKLIELLAKI